MRASTDKTGQISVQLDAGESLGFVQGPTTFAVGMASGNVEYDALMLLVDAGTVVIKPYVDLTPSYDSGLTMFQILN